MTLPSRTHSGKFLIQRYFVENKLPTFVVEKYLECPNHRLQPPSIMICVAIPSQVTRYPARRSIKELYPQSPSTISDYRSNFKGPKTEEPGKAVQITKQKLDDSLDLNSGNLAPWACVTRASHDFHEFMPVIMKCNSDNEFGPGICASDIFDKAMLYAWPPGAIMIFKTPEVQNISVWKANTADWNVLTAI